MDYTSELTERDAGHSHEASDVNASPTSPPASAPASTPALTIAEPFSKLAALAYSQWETLRGEAELPTISHSHRSESRLFTPNCVQVAWDEQVSVPTISYLGEDLAQRLASLSGATWPNLPIESPLVVLLHDVSLRAIRLKDAMEFDEQITDSDDQVRGLQGIALPFAGVGAGTFLVDVLFDLDSPSRIIAEAEQNARIAPNPEDVLLLEQEIDPEEMPRPAQTPPQQPVLFVCVSDEDRPPARPPDPDFPRSMARALALFSNAAPSAANGKRDGRTVDVPLLLTEALEDGSEPEVEAVHGAAYAADDHLLLSLQIARDRAAAASGSEERSHIALYKAIGAAYDFALHATAAPERFDRIIEEAGLKAQVRAPMTPVVKVIFGIAYDRTRLAEYATALSHALRVGLPADSFADYLQAYEGGLKGVVRAERQLRRKAKPAANSRLEKIAQKLRDEPVRAFDGLAPEGEEFALVIARRMSDGSVSLVGEIPPDDRLLCSAAQKFFKKQP